MIVGLSGRLFTNMTSQEILPVIVMTVLAREYLKK
jgi:F0F1-type ATP synthase membrane subunit a